jgi:hypothetical protein
MPKCQPAENTDGRFFSALPTPFIPEQIEFFDVSLQYIHKHPDWDSQFRREQAD